AVFDQQLRPAVRPRVPPLQGAEGPELTGAGEPVYPQPEPAAIRAGERLDEDVVGREIAVPVRDVGRLFQLERGQEDLGLTVAVALRAVQEALGLQPAGREAQPAIPPLPAGRTFEHAEADSLAGVGAGRRTKDFRPAVAVQIGDQWAWRRDLPAD